MQFGNFILLGWPFQECLIRSSSIYLKLFSFYQYPNDILREVFCYLHTVGVLNPDWLSARSSASRGLGTLLLWRLSSTSGDDFVCLIGRSLLDDGCCNWGISNLTHSRVLRDEGERERRKNAGWYTDSNIWRGAAVAVVAASLKPLSTHLPFGSVLDN